MTATIPTNHAPITVTPDHLAARLAWRYATKKFDPTRAISPEHWSALEHALVMAPSSFGMQPWKFVVVRDRALREQLRAAAWNQSQITDASHLVVLARRSPVTTDDVAKLMRRIASVRSVSEESLKGYRTVIEGFLSTPGLDVDGWAARQVYLALGFFLKTCALLGIDACPMEGFDAGAFDAILGLRTDGYRATVVATAGYRSADDGYAGLPKVRFPRAELIEHR